MRKVTYGGAISLDGFLAGPGESIDWLRHSDDTAKIAAESFRGVDSMLMGRKTWEFAQRMGGRPPLKGVTTYVFSRTLESVGEGATLVKEDAAEFVRRMKGEAGGPSSSLATSNILVMGGGEIGSALLEAGLVDEVGFSIRPVLLGGGVPAFQPFTHRVGLELIETRPLANDCVLVRYGVVN
jgi:dihydrofolate reductase